MADHSDPTTANGDTLQSPPTDLNAAAHPLQSDTIMADAAVAAPSQPTTTAAPASSSGTTPQPARSTPARATPTPAPAPEPEPLPSKAVPHGAPARQYLNEKVTGVLLQGMKRLALEKPEDPLRVLGEFLLAKSKELEGSGA